MDRRRYALALLGLVAAFAVLTGMRPDNPDSTGLFRFEPGYDVDTYDSDGGRVRVHFTRSGPDAAKLTDADQGANWSEATAVWASERFDPTLHDFESFIGAWFEEPNRSVDQEPIGPVDGYSYGLAIFAGFLGERYEDDLHRRLWERLEDGDGGVEDPQWLPTLAALLADTYDTTFDAAWIDFADWVLRSSHGGAAGTTFANAASYPRVDADAVTLPFSKERLRVYRASLQVWSVAPAGRARVAVALPTADPSELDGLTLILATRQGGSVTSVVLDGTAGAIDASGADEVLAVVVNTLRDGDSRRPGLCLGDADEVAAGVEAIAPGNAEPDDVAAGDAPDAATGDDAGDALGGDAGADEDTARPASGGGCGGAPNAAPGTLTLLALGLALAWRRRYTATQQSATGFAGASRP